MSALPYPMRRSFALTSLALGLLLPGCPLTDEYYVALSTGGASPVGTSGTTSGVDATGGTPIVMPGGGDGNGPDPDPAGGEAGSAGEATGGTGGTGGDLTGAGGSQPSNGGSGGNGATSGTTSAGGNGGTAGDGQGGTPAAGSSTGGSSRGGRTGAGRGGRSSGGRSSMGGATAGGAGNGGSANDAYQPRCGEDVGKGDPCSPSSVQLCYKTCGPNSIGFKSETCQQGAYVEQSGCTFPDENDYSCYAIPASKPATCPAGTPRAAEDCGVAECTLCFGGGLANPTYQDSSGTQKEGYCVCTDAGEWTCASVPSWPCPGGDGCN